MPHGRFRPLRLLLPLLLALVASLAACQAPAATTAEPVTLVITLANGGVTPNAEVVQVKAGAQVTLDISTDRDDTLHVHGYDLEIPLTAGQQVTRTFTADRIGRVEVETHSPARTVAFLDVR